VKFDWSPMDAPSRQVFPPWVRFYSPSLADMAVFAAVGEFRSSAKIPLGTKGIR